MAELLYNLKHNRKYSRNDNVKAFLVNLPDITKIPLHITGMCFVFERILMAFAKMDKVKVLVIE